MESLGAYRKSPTLFRAVPSSTPYGLPFPKIGGSQPHPITAITIISGTSKATNFKFCTHIPSIDRNKSPCITNFGKRSRVYVVRTLETFQGTHILGASHGLFCDSSAVLSSIFTRFRDIAAFVLQHATFPHPTSSILCVHSKRLGPIFRLAKETRNSITYRNLGPTPASRGFLVIAWLSCFV